MAGAVAALLEIAPSVFCGVEGKDTWTLPFTSIVRLSDYFYTPSTTTLLNGTSTSINGSLFSHSPALTSVPNHLYSTSATVVICIPQFSYLGGGSFITAKNIRSPATSAPPVISPKAASNWLVLAEVAYSGVSNTRAGFL